MAKRKKKKAEETPAEVKAKPETQEAPEADDSADSAAASTTDEEVPAEVKAKPETQEADEQAPAPEPKRAPSTVSTSTFFSEAEMQGFANRAVHHPGAPEVEIVTLRGGELGSCDRRVWAKKNRTTHKINVRVPNRNAQYEVQFRAGEANVPQVIAEILQTMPRQFQVI